MLPSCYETLAEALRTTIRLEFRVLTDLFILYARDHSTKIDGLLSFNISFLHDHSTKNSGPHWFIFSCARDDST